jgi:hypothetical protein
MIMEIVIMFQLLVVAAMMLAGLGDIFRCILPEHHERPAGKVKKRA